MIIKCKMCGGDIQFNPGDTCGQCDHCGCTTTFPKLPDEQRANLFNRANHFRRQCEFDKAMAAYEHILEVDDTDAEAHWGIVLSKFGIEYVEDPVTHERIPTCHRAQVISILSDEDYQNAIKYAPDTQAREIYETEAKRIAEIQKGILAISSQEKPYDVFICYKETDDSGSRTKDSTLAQEIYYQLTNEGYKVFFSRITLEDKLGQEYEPYIFAALNSAKVMLVVGTKPENFSAIWVKNEWSRFLAIMKNDRKRVLIPCYRDMDPYDLPEELSSLQSQDMSKIGFMQDLIHGVKKVLGSDKQSVPNVTVQSAGPGVASLHKRAVLFLEDSDWDSASEYFDRILDIDPEYAPAYIGKVQVKKASSDPAADTNDAASPYSLAGAVYTLYDSDGAAAGTLQTNKDGSSNVLTVKCGSYTLKETKPSPGFALDVTSHKVTVTGGSNTTVSSIEPVLKAKLTVKKVSSEEKEGKAPDTLPIKGAVYSLYQTEEDAREEKACAGTFLVQEDGTANVLEVIAGKTYYIKETKTPEGYLTDEKIHAVRAALPLETYTVESEDKLIFGGVRVGKRDLETGGQNPLGGASLEGAVMKIYNDGTLSVYADGKKILPGGEAMTLVTEADGTAATPDHALSYGSYRVEETLPPEGYTMEGAKPVRFKITEDGKIIDLSSSEETSVKDRVMRGDFSIRKIQGYTQKRMAGVTFEITSYDKYGKELEKHRFTTDENGFFDSKASWAAQQRGQKKPQEADAADAGDDTGTQNAQQNGQTQENGDAAQAEEESGRLWFGVGTKPDERLGALPYGSYHIEEIEGENNRGMKMYSDDFSIYGDGQALALGNIENTLKPVLETELVDENGDHFADQKGIITLTDTVTYGGMEDYIGKEVTFHGVIYVKETQKPLQIGGRTIESVVTRKILSPAGTVRLQFTFDAAGAQGMTLVCFEYASEPGPVEDDPAGERPDSPHTGDYHDSTNGGEDIVSHTDIDDASQTVQQISIETDARDQLTGMHVGEARDGAVTVDHVTCRGVTPGQDYLVTGFLVDKATGSPLKDHSGKRITAKASFTAKKTVETVDLTFTYDASLLEGTTVVAFERLYLKGGKKPAEPKDDTPDHPSDDTPDTPDDEPDDTPVARHEDPEDEDQSVHYPKIRTKAAAANSSDENSAAGNIGSTENSPDAGKSGGSSALVRETELTKSVTADGKLIVRDYVSWKNLLPGRNYRLQGSLIRKDDGKPFTVDGSPLTARVQFTPGTPDGETILDFAFDGTALFAKSRTAAESGDQSGTQKLQSMEIVAFEELYILTEDSDGQKTGDSGDGKKQDTGREYLVASHKDLQDPAQTVLLREPETPQTPGKYTDIPEEPGKSNGLEKEEKGSAKGSGRKSVTPASPQTVRNGSPVKTGDETNLAAYLLPFALAALGITALVIAGRHRNNKR